MKKRRSFIRKLEHLEF